MLWLPMHRLSLGCCYLQGSYPHSITACTALSMHLSHISTNWIGNGDPKERHSEPLAMRTGNCSWTASLAPAPFFTSPPDSRSSWSLYWVKIPATFYSPALLSRGSCHPSQASPSSPKAPASGNTARELQTAACRYPVPGLGVAEHFSLEN